MIQKGSCHCGKVTFEADGPVGAVMECNCSHCSRKGFLLWFVPRTAFRITAGEADLSSYRFNQEIIEHLFCSTCGCQAFGFGVGPDGRAMAAVNLRCLEGVDLEILETQKVDGRSL